MPVSEEALKRYRAQIGRYRDRTSLLLVAAWDGLGSYDEPDIKRYVERTAPILAGAKSAAVGLSAAFFALTLGIRPVAVSPRSVDIEPDTAGPFRAMWHAFAMGRPFEEALGVGRSTAQAVGFDFVQSTARRTGGVVAEMSGRTVRWRRHTTGKSCSWCVGMTGHTFATADAADFGHERCDCDVIPA